MLILEDLWEKGIKIEKESAGKNFVIEETKLYKGIGWFSVITFVGGTFLCIYVKLVYGYLFCGVMAVLSVFDLLNKFKKIIVSDKAILVVDLLKGKKEVPFSEIEYIERKKKDGVEVTYVYSNKGFEFRYRSVNKNAHAFEGIIDKYNWRCK